MESGGASQEIIKMAANDTETMEKNNAKYSLCFIGKSRIAHNAMCFSVYAKSLNSKT